MLRLALLVALPLACFPFDPVAIGGSIEQAVLEDLNGARTVLTLTGKTTAIVFLSAECPISNEYNDRMIALHHDYAARGVQWIFVNANQNESVALVKDHVRAAGFPFSVYKDRANRLANRLGASVTPEAFVIDSGGKLRYRGHIDDSRNPARVQLHGLREALEATLKGEPVARQETKAFGCTIKRVRKTS
jgi:hypothetical protein